MPDTETYIPVETDVISVTMRNSSQVAEIFDALSKAQIEISGARKDAVNPHFKSKYPSLESVMDACRPALNRCGICVIQPVAVSGNRVTVTTVLGHRSGQWVATDLEMVAGAATPQAIGSTITYGRRYGLQSMAGVAAEDDDGNAGSTPASPFRKEPAPTGISHQETGSELENLLQSMRDRETIARAIEGLRTRLAASLGQERASQEYERILHEHGVDAWEDLRYAPKARQFAADLHALLEVEA